MNVNRSAVPCASDRKRYTVRGHLVAPEYLLNARRPRAVTLYLHGALIGEATWRLPVPGYGWAYAEAQAGHASVTYDQLGYGRSDIADGSQACVGSQADIAHQIVTSLHAGSYQVAGHPPVSFQRIALADLSFGGVIAPVEAYSFKDIDALVNLSSAFDQGFPPAVLSALLLKPDGVALGCARGGQPKRAGEPSGYSFTFTDSMASSLFYKPDPAVVQAVLAGKEPDPCGLGESLVTTLAVDRTRLETITVPVLLIFGDHDVLFPPPDGEQQKALYTGSDDVTYDLVGNTGHAIPGERSAPTARNLVSNWLRTRGF